MLDEATATADLVQATIRWEFVHSFAPYVLQVLVLDEATAAADLVQGPPFRKEFVHSLIPYVCRCWCWTMSRPPQTWCKPPLRKEFVHSFVQ